MQATKHKSFRRLADGVLGVGYELEYAGTRMASIAWPDREAEKIQVDDYARNGVEELIAAAAVVGEVAEDVVAPDGEVILKAGDKVLLDDESATVLTPEQFAAAQAEASRLLDDVRELESDRDNFQEADITSDNPPPDGAEPTQQATVSDQAQPAPSEADQIRAYLHDHGTGTANKAVIAAFAAQGIKITSQQVSNVKAELKAAG